MADLRRFSVDKPCLQHFRNSIKNVERAAENMQNALQNHSWAPKNDPKGGQEDQKIEPKPQDDKRTEPRRSQDRLGHPQGPKRVRLPYPQGSILAPKTAPKRSRKRSKIEAKKQEAKKTIQDDLGPVLERSWVIWGHHLE